MRIAPTTPRLVITGAPASGKSTCIERLKKREELRDFVFFEELARRLLEEDPTYRDRWHEFHLEIYRRQVAREERVAGRPFLTDRGTIDAFAFHPETAAQVGTTIEREFGRYTRVFHLGSTASLGAAHYRSDEVRTETIAEALEIEAAIARVWKNHPGYCFVDPDPDFGRKYERLAALVVAASDRIAEAGA